MTKEQRESVLNAYLPACGEGKTRATQAVTAVIKLEYRWYNDGDVFDNTRNNLRNYGMDISSYANWLAKHIAGTGDILMGVYEADDEERYSKLLQELSDYVLDEERLAKLHQLPAIGTIYECEGTFRFVENDEYDKDW